MAEYAFVKGGSITLEALCRSQFELIYLCHVLGRNGLPWFVGKSRISPHGSRPRHLPIRLQKQPTRKEKKQASGGFDHLALVTRTWVSKQLRCRKKESGKQCSVAR